jgi:hypothetical protein
LHKYPARLIGQPPPAGRLATLFKTPCHVLLRLATLCNALSRFVTLGHALSRLAKYVLEKHDKAFQSVSQRFKAF